MKHLYLLLIGMLSSLICLAEQGSESLPLDVNPTIQPSIWGNAWVLVGTVVFTYLFLAVVGGKGLNSPKH